MSLATLIDCIILSALALSIVDGYRRGFIFLLLELVGTFFIFFLAFRLAIPIGSVLGKLTHLIGPSQRLLGFISVWFVTQALYTFGTDVFYRSLPEVIRDSPFNKLAGTIPSVIKGLITLAVSLTLLMLLPVKQDIRQAISQSRLGRPLVDATQNIQQQLLKRFGKEINETLTFLTNTPLIPRQQSNEEAIALHFTTGETHIDAASEETMLQLVNRERKAVGRKPLVVDRKLREVARAHGKDMFARGYFAHNTPEGKDPFDRMQAAGIVYLTAGENLALAPTVELAHLGLMNSPKHKDNILYPDFGHIGVGVIDGGIYGKMFVQEFTD